MVACTQKVTCEFLCMLVWEEWRPFSTSVLTHSFLCLKITCQDTCWIWSPTISSWFLCGAMVACTQKVTCEFLCMLVWEEWRPFSTSVLTNPFLFLSSHISGHLLNLASNYILVILVWSNGCMHSEGCLWVSMHACVRGMETFFNKCSNSLFSLPKNHTSGHLLNLASNYILVIFVWSNGCMHSEGYLWVSMHACVRGMETFFNKCSNSNYILVIFVLSNGCMHSEGYLIAFGKPAGHRVVAPNKKIDVHSRWLTVYQMNTARSRYHVWAFGLTA